MAKKNKSQKQAQNQKQKQKQKQTGNKSAAPKQPQSQKPKEAPPAKVQPDKAKAKRSRTGCLLKLIIILLLLTAAGLAGLHIYSQMLMDDIVPERQDEVSYFDDRINVLVLGTDTYDTEEGRSDSIMVFNIDLENKLVNALSIPRDSRVSIPGYRNKTKINHAYAYGGIDLTRQTVEELLGIPIDYYAVTSFDGFEGIVDTLGGIYVDVPIRMKTHKGGGIDLQPGYQLLDGHQLLGFVRYRGDAGGDIARAGRQQQALRLIYQELIDPANITKLPAVITQLMDMVSTDLTYNELLALINHFKYVDLETAFHSETLGGGSQTIDGGSYWLLDDEQMADAVQRLFFADPLAVDADAAGAADENGEDAA